MTQRKPIVAVVGGNDSPKPLVDAAYAVGKAIAEAGAVLLTGSQPMDGEDIKRASMRGALAAEKDGVVARRVGILPAGEKPQSSDVAQCLVETGLNGAGRNPVTGMTCDAMLLFEGGSGTLAELGFALAAQKPVLFAGSIERLKYNAKHERHDLQQKLASGVQRFPNILGRPVDPVQIADLIDQCLNESSDSTAISEDDSSWVGPLVQKAIESVPPEVLRRESGFPDGVPGLSKEEFETSLGRM